MSNSSLYLSYAFSLSLPLLLPSLHHPPFIVLLLFFYLLPFLLPFLLPLQIIL